jgi:hypothetical protein
MEKITSYKGMNQDMTCLDKKYKVGETYKEDTAEPCKKGFHACQSPLDVFGYYEPSRSRYFEVEQAGIIKQHEDKTCSSELTVKAEIGIIGMVKAHIEWVFKHLKKSDDAKVSNTGYQSAASNTGYRSAASNTGYQSAASNTGYQSAASNTGDRSAASNTGYQSAASVEGKNSIAMAMGIQSRAMTKNADSWIVICDWRKDKNNDWYMHNTIAVKPGKKVQKTVIKVNVWYWFEDGELRQEKSSV